MAPGPVQKRGAAAAAAAAAAEAAGWQRHWVEGWHAGWAGLQGHRAAGRQGIPVHSGGG